MIEATFGSIRRVLCIGAHADDIEIGCGATVLRMLRESPGIEVFWLVLSSDARRAAEARRSALAFLGGARRRTISIGSFRDGFLPYLGEAVKERFEALKREFEPDLIFTHCRGDRHQDHRVANELTWNTYRDHLILEYEIPKYDADLGSPNVFVAVGEALGRRKLRMLMRYFGSQRSKRWFTPEVFSGLMRLRAVEAGSPSPYAEAFHARKLVVGAAGFRRAGGR